MNLSAWAGQAGVSKYTAYRWYHVGALPVPARRAGRLILVEHRDRRARFGVGHIQAALAAQGRRIMILDSGGLDDGLVRDMTGVLASFCARLYGRRRARSLALRALDCAEAPALPADGEAGA